ncbi:hypothetical protein F5Y19DRAFT_492070 [Xylariaceae sp. FL1651]|nr:hypothetical protein F5Y19DRAFT_492070 [Xylariaceae sp. FL1651]
MYSTNNTEANGGSYHQLSDISTDEPLHEPQHRFISGRHDAGPVDYSRNEAGLNQNPVENISGRPFINSIPEGYIGGQYASFDPGRTPVYQSPDPEPKAQQLRYHFSLYDWGWEFGSAIVSIASTVAIIVILSVENGKALSEWRFPIAPNSLVSVFSTIAKSALLVSVASCLSQLKWIYFGSSHRPLHHFELFEDASRGPWGSVVLSWVVHIRAKLALFGSIVTIVALALEPFTQQILAFPSRAIPSDRPASFGIGLAYDSGIGLAKTKTVFGLPIDSKMQGAIMSGLYNTEAPVRVQCPTGNCTWPPFTTMALTTKCSNVTENTKTNCTSSGPSEECTYITPSGFNISASASFSQGGSTFTLFNSSAQSQWDRSSDWANSTLLRFAAVNISSTIGSTGATEAVLTFSQYESPYAIECDMTWTARTFQGIKVVNGTFIAGATEDHDLEGIPLQSDTEESEWWYPGPYQFRIRNASTDTSKNLTFLINPNDHGIIAGHLEEVFSSNSDDDFGMALMQSSDLIETIRNISTSVTFAIGQGSNATSAPGTAFMNETYISVEWGWFILPFLTILGSIVFLVATVLYSKRRNVASWKSSSLLPLFTRFVGWNEEDLAVNSPQDMTMRVHQMRGRFDIAEGPRLTAA